MATAISRSRKIKSGSEIEFKPGPHTKKRRPAQEAVCQAVRPSIPETNPGLEPLGIVAQIRRIREIFPELRTVNDAFLSQIEGEEISRPAEAQGWFAIGNWTNVQPIHPRIPNAVKSEGTLRVIRALKRGAGGFSFINLKPECINDQSLRFVDKTRQCLERMSVAQGGKDILLVPAQFGAIMPEQRSLGARRKLSDFQPGEFGLDVASVGLMLLVDPRRLSRFGDNRIECSGQEINNPASRRRFDHTPYFFRCSSSVRLNVEPSKSVSWNPNTVSASGFCLQAAPRVYGS